MAKKGIKGRLKQFLESGPGGEIPKVKNERSPEVEEDDEDDAS
jgi:hypothetical protein